ncbi:hypothetical protein [Oceanobacillus sp. FSL K6-0251]|uniref:hypothetical protein n=1 Tax=Oceanobacillus sp. FSL K6-0251 TaxID=2921602 RepID=UPI0030F5314D
MKHDTFSMKLKIRDSLRKNNKIIVIFLLAYFVLLFLTNLIISFFTDMTIIEIMQLPFFTWLTILAIIALILYALHLLPIKKIDQSVNHEILEAIETIEYELNKTNEPIDFESIQALITQYNSEAILIAGYNERWERNISILEETIEILNKINLEEPIEEELGNSDFILEQMNDRENTFFVISSQGTYIADFYIERRSEYSFLPDEIILEKFFKKNEEFEEVLSSLNM